MPASTCTHQISLLMWKRRLIATRSWRTTLIEMFIPLLFLLAFNAPGLSKSKPKTHASIPSVPNTTTPLGMMSSILEAPVYPSIGPFSDTYIPSKWDNSTTPGLMYYPNTSKTVSNIMQTIATNILTNNINPIPLHGFKSEKDMVDYYESHPMTIWAGICFHQIGTSDDAYANNVNNVNNKWEYSIRINGSYVPSTNTKLQTMEKGHLGGADGNAWQMYHSTAFLQMQYAVDQAITHAIATNPSYPPYPYQPPAVPKDLPSLLCFADAGSNKKNCNVTANIGFHRLPSMNDPTSNLLWIFKWLPGWCLNVASVFFFSSQLSPRILEKKHRLTLSLMGMSDVASHLAHLITSAIFALPLAILYTIICFASTLTPLLKQADRSVQTIFLFCFAFGLAYVLTLVTTSDQGGEGNGVWKLILALVPFGAAHLGGELVIDLEGRDLGLTLGNLGAGGIWIGSGGSNNPSFVELLIVVATSIVGWSLVGYWLSAVLRDPDHGERRALCFCCQCSCTNRKRNAAQQGRGKKELLSPLMVSTKKYGSDVPLVVDSEHEQLTAEQIASTIVSVRNLTKIYTSECGNGSSANKTAVNNLSFSLQKNQIFCLLGHNGAGKTSTIRSMTSGSFESGEIQYTLDEKGQTRTYNLQSEQGREHVRKNIGLCPQHDVLWNECTPYEHLRFFSLLKGISTHKVDEEVKNILAKIRLPIGDEHRAVGSFSGGNKRKVSLAMALVGNPQVVFLDEPTAGMDPSSRRGVWDVLQSVKQGRSIVLCTHFMDEADLLGDRIGIMAHGRMAAVGSSLFLKHTFGNGYTLTVRPPKNNHHSSQRGLETIVKSIVSTSIKKNSIERRGRVIQEVYELPFASQKKFPTLLRALEKSNVKDVVIGHVTLEAVFLEVGRRLETQKDEIDGESKYEIDQVVPMAPISPRLTSSNRSFSRLVREEKSAAHCLRRLRSARLICDARYKTMTRSPNMIATQVIIPIVMVFLAFSSVSFLKKSPYVVPDALSFSNLTNEWSSNCNVELIGFQNSNVHLHNSLHQSMKDFYQIREWNTIPEMENNLSSLLATSSTTHSYVPSCGGLIYTDQTYTEGSTTFPKNSIVLVPNSSLVPSAPIFLNIHTNAILLSNQYNTTISTLSHPLPYHVPQVVDTASLFLPMFAGMGFLSSGLGGLALVSDRESHRRVVLRLRGLPSSSYIMGHFFFDVGCLSVPLMLLSVFLIYIFQVSWLIGIRVIGFLIISIVGTIGTAALGYASSSLFHDLAMASRILPALLPAITVIPFVVIFVIKNQNLIDTLSTIFCICPPYALQEGIKRLMSIDVTHGQPTFSEVMFVLRDPIVLALSFTAFALFRVHLMEGGSLRICCCVNLQSKKRIDLASLTFHEENEHFRRDSGMGSGLGLTIGAVDGGNEDDTQNISPGLRIEFDDEEEDECENNQDDTAFLLNVSRGFSTGRPSFTPHTSVIRQSRTFSDSSTNGIRIRSLVKEFGTHDANKIRAINGLSLEVRRGELVGFLGPNGAGKTTTMSILSTEIEKTFGEITVGGLDVSNLEERNMLRSQAILGFCPQFDALFESLTVMEHFALWGTIQGETETGAISLGQELAYAIGLKSYFNVQSSKLSGGNKRKLSIALALLGSPDVLLLDEPSTGVDVSARRVIWNLLHGFREHAAVLLSTHSMEEAVAISDRIAVVVKGKVAADGTVAELQQKYGEGFVLEVMCEAGCGDKVEEFVIQGSLCGVLKERFDERLKFILDPSVVDLASAFEIMESTKCGVKFFSISHATMEDIFMNLLLKKNN